jgi:hypothetical protein
MEKEDGGSRFFRKIGTYLPDYTAWHRSRSDTFKYDK